MRELRKKAPLRTTLVAVLCAALICLSYPAPSSADSDIPAGAATPDEAGAPDLGLDGGAGFTLAGWKPSMSFLSSSAAADTTDLEFPEDEEEGTEHLVRDIGIFLVVSAFLAYFLIKVFLEGDEEEQPVDDDGGKEIPATTRVNQRGWQAW